MGILRDEQFTRFTDEQDFAVGLERDELIEVILHAARLGALFAFHRAGEGNVASAVERDAFDDFARLANLHASTAADSADFADEILGEADYSILDSVFKGTKALGEPFDRGIIDPG